MLSRRNILIVALIALGNLSLPGQTDIDAEAQKPGTKMRRFYLGISAGFPSSISLGDYSYWLPVGVSGLYNGGNHSVSLSYSRLFPLSISLESSSPSDYTPRFDRLEALYAYSVRVGGTTGFFRGLTLGATTGASLNFMSYRQDYWSEPIHERVIGVPFGILATSPPGEPLYGGIQMKAHFLHGHTPHMELLLFVMGGIF